MRMSQALLTAVLTIVLAAAASAQAPSDDALVAHYTFDEGQGDVLRDHSGKGNDGKIFGAQWEKLAEGYALKFDGVDDLVDCGNDQSMRAVAKEGSVCVWLNPAKYEGGILAWHTGSGWPDERFVFAFSHYQTDDSVFYILADGNFYARGKWVPPPLNEWTHYALTLDGTKVRQYANGILLDEWDQGDRIPDFGGAPLRLGVSKGLGPAQYQGLLDEIRIYDRALSPAELFDRFAEEAGRKGVPVPQGTDRLGFRAQASLEEQKLTFNLDVSELRPIRKGMAVRLEVPATRIAKTLPLDPSRWKYEITLDARKLEPGDYVAHAKLLEKTRALAGRRGQVGTVATADFRWRKLSDRLNHLTPADKVQRGDLVGRGGQDAGRFAHRGLYAGEIKFHNWISDVRDRQPATEPP